MQRTRRPVLFALLGLLLCAAAGYLIYDHMQPHTTAPINQRYTYKVTQSASSSAHYTQNKFFASTGSPTDDDTAYVASLTDYLNSSLNYNFTASSATDLHYSYKVDAVLHSKYSGKDSAENAANVWTKNYSLLGPIIGSQMTKALTLNPSVHIPFADYVAATTQFRSTLNIPVGSVVVVTYTVQVSGKANNVPFTNTQVSTITAPLDQPVYKIAVQFNKTDTRTVVSKRARQLEDIVSTYEFPLAVVMAALGLGLVVYGFRKQIIKSPYQRELARIYRYNNGIIVKARRPVSLKNKTIVDLNSFDDLLSVEEETGSPIVADELSNTATRFIITKDDTAYVYTLGGSTPKEATDDRPPESPKPPAPPTPKPQQKPAAKSAPKTATKISVENDDRQLEERVDRMMKIQ